MTEDHSLMNDAQRLILEAAIACVEKFGIEKVTVRRIAEEAGVNIASINYYFRSKANLMNAVLKLTIGNMLADVAAAINRSGLSFEERLEEVFFYLLEGATRYPKITTAHLYDAVVCKKYDSEGINGIPEMFKNLVARAREELPEKPPEKIRFTLAQILYASIFLMLTPDLLEFPAEYHPGHSRAHTNLAREYTRMFFAALG